MASLQGALLRKSYSKMDDYEKQIYGLINRSPDVTSELRGLFDDASTLGVNEVRSGPLLNYGLMGVFDTKNPSRVTLDRVGINRDYGPQSVKETLAHESEHARQTQAGQPYSEIINHVPQAVSDNIISTAKAHPRGGVSVQKQPTILEALAFIRGKEATNDKDLLRYLQPTSQQFVDKLMYPGYDKVVSPDAFISTQPPRKPPPSEFDLLRRKIRNFTSR